MRNLKRLLAVVVTFIMIFTLSIATFAETTTTTTAPAAKTDADICKDLGMILGSGAGVTADYLASKPTRLQGAILFLRLKGLEADAKAYLGTDNFDDATGFNADNTAILAYLKNHPDLGYEGVGDNKFAPNDLMTAKAYYKVLLVALGYKYGTDATADFTWNNVFSFGAGKGLSKLIDNETFTINDVATGTIEALKLNPKGGTANLLSTLVDAGAVTADVATATGFYTKPAPAALAVTGVTAVNLKEINVTFNKDLDSDSAKAAANYTLSAGTVSKAELVGTTGVLLTLTAAAAQQASIDVTIKSVKDSGGTAIADTTKSVQMIDTIIPQFTGVTVTGPKTLDVTFSEPLATVPTFKIDNGTYYVANNFAAGAKTVTLTMGVELAAGSHTVTAKDGLDYAGYKVPETAKAYTYAADTTVPTVSVSAATETKVTLTFSKKVDIKTPADVSVYYAYNNDNANYKGTLSKDADATDAAGYCDKWYATFVTPIPAGAQTLYLNTKANAFEDKYANDVASAVIPITVVTDTVKPTVASVAMDSGSDKVIKVTFSEDVQAYDATNKAYFTLLDAAGNVVKNATYGDVDDNGHFNVKGNITYASKVATITASDAIPGGNYYLKVEKVRDTAYIKNTMDAATVSFTVADKTAPTVSSAIVSGDNKKIRVTFSEAMSTTNLTTTSNYRLVINNAADVKLPDNSTVSVVDAKTVEIALPAANANIDGTNDAVWVGGSLTDVAGNAIGGFYASTAIGTDGITYVADSAKATAKNTITFQVNKELSAVDVNKFIITCGALAVSSAYAVNESGKSTVTVILSGDMLPDVSNFTSMVATGGALTNIFGTANQVITINTAGNTKLLDKISPAVTSVAALTVTTVAVTFSELIDTTTVSKYTFTVPGANVKAITWPVDNAHLLIELDTALATDAAPQLTQAIDLTDVAGNKLAAGTSVAATADKVVPVAKQYADDNSSFKVNSATQITVVFSEAMDSAKFAVTSPNGFSIAGAGAITKAELSGDGRYVTITGTGFVATTTTVAYTAGTLTDTNGNALATFGAVATH